MSAFEINNFDNNDDLQPPRRLSEPRNSVNSSLKRSNSDNDLSTMMLEDEDEVPQELKPITKSKQPSQIPKPVRSNKLSTSMENMNTQSPSLKANSSSKTR